MIKKAKDIITLDGETILVTGSPGFIGANLVIKLLKDMNTGTIISLDNMNDYYDPKLKEARLDYINDEAKKSSVSHIFIKGNIADKSLVGSVFEKYRPTMVVNLAAQAGVRYSIDNPNVYIESNIIGFFNILEACRHSYDNSKTGVKHLVFASSSSVYGGNQKIPFSVDDKVDTPVSLYAATKKSDEMLAHCYSKLYDIPTTALRFFTVYGPAGRPDMFYYSATEKLIKGDRINIFNRGDCMRDFTYIDDIVEGIVRVMQGAPIRSKGMDGLPNPPFSIYNIGGGMPVKLKDFIDTLVNALIENKLLTSDYNLDEHSDYVGMQPGDVRITYADSADLEKDYGFKPSIGIEEGLSRFVLWYKNYTS